MPAAIDSSVIAPRGFFGLHQAQFSISDAALRARPKDVVADA